MSNFLQLLFIGLLEGSLYAMVAAAIVLVYKSTHIVSLAHGQLMAYGALAFWFALTILKLPFLVALLLALIILAGCGWLIERLAMRPLIGQPLFAAFLTTFALFLLGDGIFQLILKGESTSFAAYLPGGMTPVLGVSLPTTQLISFGVCLALFLCLAIFFQKTKMGLGMRASAEDHQLAQSTGISVRAIFSWIWIISAMVATIAGIALANVMDIYFPLPYVGVKGLIVALVGGLESLPGALLAGLLLGVLENVSAGYLDPLVGGGVKEVAAYVLLLFILLVKPYGLFGLVRIERI
ncbi:MAG: branched-chain amino acid ABC transporter permease [Desulfobacterales bacterium]|nr:MAG: branched-chain amino acid ABC transporter permease [Desulfobacterales bacterium]